MQDLKNAVIIPLLKKKGGGRGEKSLFKLPKHHPTLHRRQMPDSHLAQQPHPNDSTNKDARKPISVQVQQRDYRHDHLAEADTGEIQRTEHLSEHKFHLISSHLSFNREGRWGTTDDFATNSLHFSLFYTALWDLANTRLVHSLMSSYLFLCLPSLLLLSLCLARWFRLDLMKGRHDHTTAV